MRFPNFNPNRFKFIPAWVASGLLDAPFLAALFLADSRLLAGQWVLSLALHVMGAVVLFFGLPRAKGLPYADRHWAFACVLFFLMLPGFGWIVTGACLFFYKPPDDLRWLLEEEGAQADEESVPPHAMVASGINRQERVVRQLDFMPLADILAGEDNDMKRGAVEKLAILKTPEAIALLLHYRSAPSPEVRFYVTTALSRIKKEFDEELEAAKREMQRDINRLTARLYLARIYLWYARSNLLDETGSQAYKKEALYHLHFVIESEQASGEAYWMLINVHCDNRAWRQALDGVLALERSGKGDPEEIMKLKIKIFFNLRDYGQVVSLFQQKGHFSDMQWNSLANWWGVTS